MFQSTFTRSLQTLKAASRRATGFLSPATPRSVFCPMPPLDWHDYAIPTFKRRGIRLSFAGESQRG